MLLDSNIIIYATQPEYSALRALMASMTPAVSAVSYVEVLGYHRLTPPAKASLESFFAIADVLPIDDGVIQTAIRLRQQKRMSLGDALVASTALNYQLTLMTHNTQDFDWVDNLELLDPLEKR